MRKTKIICTIGPASESVEVLKKMIKAGMNVARLNFSHGTHSEHKQRVDNIRAAAEATATNISIMLDTKGPEIRTGTLKEGLICLKAGDIFTLTTREVVGDEEQVMISYPHLPQEINKGDCILLADGLISLQVQETTDTDIVCRVLNGGELGERKGINVPGVRVKLPFLSDKDRLDIEFAIKHQLDFIAASFVRSAEDILEIRRILEENHADIDIIAKIESQEGVDNLEDIIKVVDGVMVARGDLGVEIPAEEVPLVQKQIIKQCIAAGKTVIIATQMLESMINNPRPTRAEVSDVANAIFDGADAIMLSGESAAGKYPVQVVETMARIARRAEEVLPYEDFLREKRFLGTSTVADAISYATCTTAMNLDASAILSATHTGHTARLISKYRPKAAIVAATPKPRILNKLNLVWGVYPTLIEGSSSTDELFEQSVQAALEGGYIKHGDLVVLTAGIPAGTPGGTNLLKVYIVGDIVAQGMGIGHEPVMGRAAVIHNEHDLHRLVEGDIVVITDAGSNLVPYLDKIKAIITEAGGLTSDAAIMGLNYNIPVVVGVKGATQLIGDGMLITVDTPRGAIYRGFARVK